MDLKAGQQVCLLYNKDVTGTVSSVRGGVVSVTWHAAGHGKPRTRRGYRLADAQRILLEAR